MNSKLAIIGASKVQQRLVLKAKEMGIETHCFAWDKPEDSVCREIADFYHPISIADKEQILAKCREIGIDGVTSVALDFAVPTVCYIAQEMGLTGNTYADALVTSNKYKMRQAFQKAGVNSPRFASVIENGPLPDFTYPVIVKPADRCASISVTKVNHKADLPGAVQEAIGSSHAGQSIVEEFVTGTEVSLDSISWNGVHYILAVRDKELTREPYFVEIAHHTPSLLSPDKQDKIRAESVKALTALNIRYGICNIEIKFTDEGKAYIIEVNPRMGGDATDRLMMLSTGYDMLKALINIALGKFEEPVFTPRFYSGIHYLGKETAWVKNIIENKGNLPEVIEAAITRNDLRELHSNVDRTGFFIYQTSKRKDWESISS